MATTMSRQFGNQTLTFETGKLAKQAGGSCVVTYGETQVLATCTTSKPREGIDFFPLTIDVEERMYAAGKIPGGFFRREGRPSETAILTARLTDRPMRPSFKEGYRDEVQVVITVLSADMANPYDIPGMNAASLATMVSGIPFEGPVGSVRLGLIGGEWRINPTFQEVEEATFDIVVAGRRNDAGEIDILMIEGEAPDSTWALLGAAEGALAPTEEVVAQGLEEAKRAIAELIDFQLELVATLDVKPKPFEPRPLYGQDTWTIVESYAKERLETAMVPDRLERETALDEIKEALKGHLLQTWGEESYLARQGEVSPAWKDLQKKVMRARVIEHGVRLDGRGPKDIRALSAEIGLVPRAHGSSLFERGDTQVLNVTTLGMLRMTQMIDTLDPEDTKRYIHHYNFPPFSTGEVGRIGSPRRREIGHGALAERALVPVVPSEEEFPYALRLVSDVLSSNGSTSMASVCASTLSLMDAGVPIKAPVAGIAMGMIAESGTFVTLTDILGAEDALGDMDFKVAGTKDFVTAIQLDMKVTGLPGDVLAGALQQAKEARLKILDVMHQAIPVPRTEVNPEGAADPHPEDPGRQDRRGDRSQGQEDQRDRGDDRGRHRHPGRRDRVRRRPRGSGGRRGRAHHRRDREPASDQRGRALHRHGREHDDVRGVREPRARARRPHPHLEARSRQAARERRGGRQGGRLDRGRGPGHRRSRQDLAEARRRRVGDPRRHGARGVAGPAATRPHGSRRSTRTARSRTAAARSRPRAPRARRLRVRR